jgi:two-component system chemotaxis response regulator CheB
MTLLHASGGQTIAEAEETAVIWGMPGELVKAGGADKVAAVEDVGNLIIQSVAVDASH